MESLLSLYFDSDKMLREKIVTALCTKQVPGLSKKYNILDLSELLLDIDDFNRIEAIRT